MRLPKLRQLGSASVKLGLTGLVLSGGPPQKSQADRALSLTPDTYEAPALPLEATAPAGLSFQGGTCGPLERLAPALPQRSLLTRVHPGKRQEQARNYIAAATEEQLATLSLADENRLMGDLLAWLPGAREHAAIQKLYATTTREEVAVGMHAWLRLNAAFAAPVVADWSSEYPSLDLEGKTRVIEALASHFACAVGLGGLEVTSSKASLDPVLSDTLSFELAVEPGTALEQRVRLEVPADEDLRSMAFSLLAPALMMLTADKVGPQDAVLVNRVHDALAALDWTGRYGAAHLTKDPVTLQELTDVIGRALGLPRTRVDLRDDLGASTGTFNPMTRRIAVNSNHNLTRDQLLEVLIHEQLHHYQAIQAERLNDGQLRRGRPGYEQAVSFHYNQFGYVSSADNFRAYQLQPLEDHARQLSIMVVERLQAVWDAAGAPAIG
jgi:hypothetical protein